VSDQIRVGLPKMHCGNIIVEEGLSAGQMAFWSPNQPTHHFNIVQVNLD